MAYVIADPHMMASAAADLATIGSNVDAAHLVAAARTTSVLPAAADEVSAGIAHLFSQHAQGYQALAGQAAAFQDQFVASLKTSAGSYAGAEAAAAASLQPLATPAATFPFPSISDVLTNLSFVAANPWVIPGALLVFGFLAYIVIVLVVLNLLIKLVGLVPPRLLPLLPPWLTYTYLGG